MPSTLAARGSIARVCVNAAVTIRCSHTTAAVAASSIARSLEQRACQVLLGRGKRLREGLRTRSSNGCTDRRSSESLPHPVHTHIQGPHIYTYTHMYICIRRNSRYREGVWREPVCRMRPKGCVCLSGCGRLSLLPLCHHHTTPQPHLLGHGHFAVCTPHCHTCSNGLRICLQNQAASSSADEPG
jgi:hypothetical protein